MVAILICFEAAIGLKINLSKSTILEVLVHDISLRHLADIMGCKVDSFTSTYLGLSLCLGFGTLLLKELKKGCHLGK